MSQQDEDTPRGRLGAVLLLMKMARQVGIYAIKENRNGLRLSVTCGDLFEGDDLAKDIAEMSEGAISADRISVKKVRQR